MWFYWKKKQIQCPKSQVSLKADGWILLNFDSRLMRWWLVYFWRVQSPIEAKWGLVAIWSLYLMATLPLFLTEIYSLCQMRHF